MAFQKKTWVNRIVQYPLRRLLTMVRPDDGSGTEIVDIQREDGEITQEGDAFSAENMNDLEQRIEEAFNSVSIDVDDELDNTSENPVQNKVIVETFSAIESIYGAKNLIPYPCNQFSRTNNGITFTDNGDGTVTANGTATADASYNISQRFGVSGGSFSLKNGNYLLSGCESGSNTTFFIQAGVTKNNVFSLLNKNFDGDTAITVDGDDNSNDSVNIAVQIIIRSGQTLTNKVFKPMIRLVLIQDNTWVPYVHTNKELTDEVKAASSTANTASSTANAALANQAKSIEPGTTATVAHSKGDYIVYGANKQFAEVLSNISVGTALTTGTGGNIKNLTQGEVLTNLNNDLNEALNIVQSSLAETHADNFSAAAQSFTSPIYFTLNKGAYLLTLNGTWGVNDNNKAYGVFIRDANDSLLAENYSIGNKGGSASTLLTINNDNTRIYGSVYNDATSAITINKLSLSYKRLY